MTRAILIDALARDIREIELPDDEHLRVAAMNAAIGGYLEVAFMWSNGDVLYVDEDGLRHDWQFGFAFLAQTPSRFWPRTFVGNGIVVGREVEGAETWSNLAPVITVDELRQRIKFYQR